VEILKQPQYDPMRVQHQVMVLYAVTNGYLDEVPIERLQEWEAGFHEFVRDQRPEIGRAILETGALSDETVDKLKAAIDEYNARFEAGPATAEPTEAGSAPEPAGAAR
jgi:F-type H+/Na+-transporting ATPase subunit alpha